MKKHLLIATTATALLASASFAFAQKTDNAGPASAAPSASPSSPGASPGAAEKIAPAGKNGTSAQSAPSATKDKAAQSAPAGSEKLTQAPKIGADSQMSPNNKMDNSKTEPSKTQAQTPSSPSATQAQKPGTSMTQSSQSGTSPSTERNAAGTQSGTNVQLSNDQRTKIRETVIKQSNAPKISRNEVNFSLSVGTVVPRTVHVAVLPAAVIEIHPQWHGYEYVLVGDEIVILEPGSLRIVAIIPA